MCPTGCAYQGVGDCTPIALRERVTLHEWSGAFFGASADRLHIAWTPAGLPPSPPPSLPSPPPPFGTFSVEDVSTLSWSDCSYVHDAQLRAALDEARVAFVSAPAARVVISHPWLWTIESDDVRTR
eukprot:6213651-Pleurochrysis_carterae.AAC.1